MDEKRIKQIAAAFETANGFDAVGFTKALQSIAMLPFIMLNLDEASARQLGEKGSAHSEEERVLFEAYMKGHCWAIVEPWDRKNNCYPDMLNRIQFAVWRDRAALAHASIGNDSGP